MSQKIVSEASALTIRIRDHLARVAVGEVVTYEMLANGVRADVQREGRHALRSARRMLEDEKIAFDVIVNVGLRRLTDKELASMGGGAFVRIRGVAARTIRKMECAAVDKLSNDDRVRLHATVSHLGAIQQFSSSPTAARIEQKVRKTLEVLPPSDAIAMFAKK